MKRFAIIVCFALLCLSGCKSKTAKNPGESETTEHDNTHYDALVAGKLSDGDRAAEARGWLDPKQTGNALWKTNREQTLKWVNTLYDAGAEKVLAVYAPKDDTIKINLCANLLVVLPKDKETRKKVIAAYNRIDKELWGSDSTKIKDEGQKYLELNMDP